MRENVITSSLFRNQLLITGQVYLKKKKIEMGNGNFLMVTYVDSRYPGNVIKQCLVPC